MATLTPTEVRQRYAEYVYETETEGRLLKAGLKATSQFNEIVTRYADLFTREQISQLEEAAKQVSGDRREALERLTLCIRNDYLYKKLAAEQDQLYSGYLQATATVGGKKYAYYDITSQQVANRDYAARERFGRAAASIEKRYEPQERRLHLAGLKQLREDFGVTDYVSYAEGVKRFKLKPFLKVMKDVQARLKPMYRSSFEKRSLATFDKPLDTCLFVHAVYLIKLPEYKSLFPKSKLAQAATQSFESLGFAVNDLPQIHVDTVSRPKKHPRAYCFVPNPPEEVHLLTKPTGGADDYREFLHEWGHCLHHALEDGSLPLEFRVLSRSHALTEIYSYWSEHLLYEPAWLEWALGIKGDKAVEVAQAARMVNLFLLLRYIAKLDFELEFYQDPSNIKKGRELYEQKLTEATGFRYPGERFLIDFDAGFYSADYLRAWVTHAQLRAYLKKTYGPLWFRNKKAGTFMRELWSRGTKPENEDIARLIGATPHDTTPLVEFYQELA